MFKKTGILFLVLFNLLFLQNSVMANDSPKPKGEFKPANEYEAAFNEMALLSQKERTLQKELLDLLSKTKDIQNQLKVLRAQLTVKADFMKEITKQHPEYLPHHDVGVPTKK